MKNLDEILASLTSREPIFHRWEHLNNRTPIRVDFESLAAPDFFEIGASGRIYTREFVISTLEQRYSDPTYTDDPWETSDFRLRQLSPTTYLLSYTLTQHPGPQPISLDGEHPQSTEKRLTRRTTIWQETTSGWQILFHQGTLAYLG